MVVYSENTPWKKILQIIQSGETSWLFKYGELIPMLAGAAIFISGLVLYNKNS
ncbi:hypothetical protein [uncultured Chryseobacterium sp.]|uniref:hypothetical protein n=1 Tax=uncultured Chryseobacterium sp. TaxID=259322 RepID=UPI00258BF7EE|nr:hypothetical protein [uncultured Chryseobacterium sp.]